MYCGKCGAARAEGDSFCPKCGAAYAEEPVSAGPIPASISLGAPAPPGDDTPYGAEMTLVAVLLGFAMPFISLIVALVLRSGEQRPSRRQFPKTWAIASGAWLCTGWIVALLAFSAVAGSIGGGGGCQGGPDPFGLPEYTSTDGKHWTAIVPCTNGGTTTRPARPGEVP
jgi:zinc ribbon protein